MACNPKDAAWYGGNLVSFIMPNAGDVYYVDGTNGSNSNDGLSRDMPVLTLTYALSLCTAGNEDYIIVLGYPSAGAAGEAWRGLRAHSGSVAARTLTLLRQPLTGQRKRLAQ